MAALDHQDDNPNDSVFESRTFPQYRPRPRPTQSQYVPATPRAARNYGASITPSSSLRSSMGSGSSSSVSTFFFTISSSSSSSSISHSPQLLQSNSYRTTFRGREAIGFRRVPPPNISRDKLKQSLSLIGTIRHSNVVQLIGASMPAKEQPFVSLVYGFVNGPTLSDCLTATSGNDHLLFSCVKTWVSRMEVALGVARGLDYIHNRTGFDAVFVHNRIKSPNIILECSSSGQLIRAMICNFGLAHASGETAADGEQRRQPLMEDEEGYPYMSPELLREGVATHESDVYAFGVLLLELISGKEPLTYLYDQANKVYVRTSIVQTAREIFLNGGENGDEHEAEKNVRCWVDKRLNNFFPVKIAMKAIRVALLCVGDDPKSRPDMGFVEGIIFECRRKSDKVFF
ncbi:LysM domain receptor-like kinase 3 [Linum perenne]